MRTDYRCPACILRVATKEAQMLLSKDRMVFIKKVIGILDKELEKAITPAHIAALREKTLKEVSRDLDPYKSFKESLVKFVSENIAPLIAKELDNLPEGYHKFRWLVLNASAMNGYEIPLHGSDDIVERFMKSINRGLGIDHSESAFDLITRLDSADIISYILDNTHEFPIDLLLIKYLEELGKTVYIFARKDPIADDVTLDEVKKHYDSPYIFGLESPLGVMPDMESETNMNILKASKLIIAKGMANYETLTELDLETPILHLLTVKCEVVAEYVGADVRSPIALLRR